MADCDTEFGNHDWHADEQGRYVCARCGLVDLRGSAIVRELFDPREPG